MNSTPIKVENLSDSISFHKKIVCREEELSLLHNYIVGKDSYCRVAGSVVLFGYGGVGKTALVIDFIHSLLRLIKDKKDEYEYDFILFYSSKDEYLKQNIRSGEIYIDKRNSQIKNFNDFQQALFHDLDICTADEIKSKYRGGIIVIDNIENIGESEKEMFYDFIKTVPRSVQFIITSRNEEPCEEKLHIKEFRTYEKGCDFIKKYNQSEGFQLEIAIEEMHALIDASKGNTLILVQCLSGLNEGTLGLDEVISNLENIRSKSVEVIADFMYKNTFENTIRELEKTGVDPKNVIRTISLYEEKIDLYSISKLSGIDIGTAESICQHLLKKLIINKLGEYYTINEFANSFIFIKLLPSNDETQCILSSIREHKLKIAETLETLTEKCSKKSTIKHIMDDWKPRNYIERIVIAEAFDTFDKIIQPIIKKDLNSILDIFEKYSEIELVTNHPYIRFQKARIYSKCLPLFKNEIYDDIKNKICRSYEDAIEAIQFSHPFIRGTTSHGAVLMLYGIFLHTRLNDHSRAIRYLEEAADIFEKDKKKNYFSTLNYLTSACIKKLLETSDSTFSKKIQKNIEIVINNGDIASQEGFNIERFKKTFGAYI